MFDQNSSILIIGYTFTALGIIATAHTLLERVFHYSLFSVFIKVTPTLLKSFIQSEPFYAWLENRTLTKNIYEMWEAVLFYLITLILVFAVNAGCWLFLILKIFSILNTPVYILIIWFIFNFIVYFISAANQAALSFRVKDRRLKKLDTIKEKMQSDQILTMKLFFKFLTINWIIAPFNTLKLLLIVLLVLLLYWPAWLIQAFQRHKKLDLTDDKTRTTYFVAYSFLFLFVGTSLTFICQLMIN